MGAVFALVCGRCFHTGEMVEEQALVESTEPEPPSACTQLTMLFSSYVYVLLMLGYCATIFTIGGLGFWAPSILTSVVALACSVFAFPALLSMAVLLEPAAWLAAAGTAQFFMFMGTYPINLGMMEAVPQQARGISLGVSTLMSHALGDLLPPTLIGMLVDASHSLRLGMFIMGLWGIWPVLLWSIAFCAVRPRREVTKYAEL